MAKPDFVKPQLMAMLSVYQMLDDCYAGERAIKGTYAYGGSSGHYNGGGIGAVAYSPYLPDPSPRNEDDDVRKHRYANYLQRAVFYNVTRRTCDGLVSAIFSKYPVLDLNELDYLEADVDGSGQSLAQQAKDAAQNALLKGRGGLLADMPVNAQGTSKAQMASGKIRPIIVNYAPESIINWRTERVGAVTKLSLVVLAESYIAEDDGYEQKCGEQLLVLRLVDGAAESEVLRKVDGNWLSESVNPLTDSAGKQLDYLPFYFYGSNNNDAEIDEPPLIDLATLNVHHFVDSADLQESNFIAGNPTLVVTGLDQNWVDNVLTNGIAIGSRSGVMLPVGGDAKLIQANANSAVYEAMQHKERQMVAIGAKLVESTKQVKTATQAAQESTEESNVLTNIAYNVSDAFTKAVRACARYVGVKEDGLFVTLNTQFNFSKLSPEQLDKLMALWQSGAISFGEMRGQLVESEYALIESVEEAAETIKQEQGALIYGGDNEV